MKPFLYPLAVRNDEVIKWHSHAESENSSQALCLSAFGSLRAPKFKAVRDRLIANLVGSVFPQMRTRERPRKWEIKVEFEAPELLSEYGRAGAQSTSIDVLLTSSQEVVALEAKFDRDAGDGFGKCSQYDARRVERGQCAGYYGPGSDLKGKTSAWCRLENWDGPRSPRAYWSLGRSYFSPSIFAPQAAEAVCPLRGSAYQLMRNFLFAAAYAEKYRMKDFGVIVVCSDRKAEVLRAQLQEFQAKVLLPGHAGRMQLTSYENWISILEKAEGRETRELAKFLKERINRVLPPIS